MISLWHSEGSGAFCPMIFLIYGCLKGSPTSTTLRYSMDAFVSATSIF